MNGTEDARGAAARRALEAMDDALSHRPKQTGHDFSAATRCLAVLREHVIAEIRERPTPELREQLARLNGVISVFYGGQFPIGAVPWEHVEKARDSFVALIGEMRLTVARSAAQS